jgi:hypothetical protein
MNKGGSRLNAFYKMEHDLMKIRPNMAHQSSLFEEQEVTKILIDSLIQDPDK